MLSPTENLPSSVFCCSFSITSIKRFINNLLLAIRPLFGERRSPPRLAKSGAAFLVEEGGKSNRKMYRRSRGRARRLQLEGAALSAPKYLGHKGACPRKRLGQRPGYNNKPGLGRRYF